MTELTAIDQVDPFIEENKFSFIYVSRTNCSVCHALLPQVKEVLSQFPNIQLGFVNADELEEIAGRLSIFTVPALLFFVKGKEVIREARFVQIEALREKIGRIYEMNAEE
ncbi:thioredoxin family protein [Alkalihalophilus lindianensis]|uniref:Thioredoxin family protein n=1 Tax=Alkalihalophilus lindianensis TaxID=1630542 RepID=A0ABU3XDV7_9BACI|nr:thioredoxin family protein [Alkalihalophilus lindianensis]MDV2686071.1 thioredoxin family protein [Alkalihalophilus lindianensis]